MGILLKGIARAAVKTAAGVGGAYAGCKVGEALPTGAAVQTGLTIGGYAAGYSVASAIVSSSDKRRYDNLLKWADEIDKQEGLADRND